MNVKKGLLIVTVFIIGFGSQIHAAGTNWIEKIVNNYGSDITVISTNENYRGRMKSEATPGAMQIADGYFSIPAGGFARFEQFSLPWESSSPHYWIEIREKSTNKLLFKFREISRGWDDYNRGLAAGAGGTGVLFVATMGSPLALIGGAIGLGIGAEAIKGAILKYIEVVDGNGTKFPDYILCQGRDCTKGFTIVVPSKGALDAVSEIVKNNPDPATRAEELKKLFAGNFELQKMFIEWQY